jgi:hypothetical protein
MEGAVDHTDGPIADAHMRIPSSQVDAGSRASIHQVRAFGQAARRVNARAQRVLEFLGVALAHWQCVQ